MQDKIKDYVSSIENLESDKKAIQEQIKEVYQEAKDEGFNTKVLRRVIQLRRKTKIEREQEEQEVQIYLDAVEE